LDAALACANAPRGHVDVPPSLDNASLGNLARIEEAGLRQPRFLADVCGEPVASRDVDHRDRILAAIHRHDFGRKAANYVGCRQRNRRC